MNTIRRLSFFLATGLLILFFVVAFNTWKFPSKQVHVAAANDLRLDKSAAVNRLSRALQLRTISHETAADFDPLPFEELHARLVEWFPRTHATLQRDVVAGYSLLYRWQGTNTTTEPVLLMSHMDVVPVEPSTESDWQEPPYSGAIADGHVWGRGALDDKVGVMAILEAVEYQLTQGFQPERTLYLAFGHDEEIGGTAGAATIARILGERGITLAMVLDEGGFIMADMIAGLDRPVAVIGIAEKGYVTLKLTARGPGGHSSIPAATTPIGILARAIRRLEENPFPADIRGATLSNFEYLGPEMSLVRRAMVANLWLFEPIVVESFLATPTLAAQLRTTTAATIMKGGVKANVIPQEAVASVNFRILPGETVDSVEEHVKRIIDDPNVEIERDLWASDPSPVSNIDGEMFSILQQTISEVAPDVIVAPYLVFGGTDAKHYVALSDSVYRFTPLRLVEEDTERFHGTNERVAVDNYLEIVSFYKRLIENVAGVRPR